VSTTELERAVTEVLIDRETLQRRISELGDEVVAVPGLVDHPEVEAVKDAGE
jgi:Icc-related predicted phosphoesterase